jgi:hypothetical protein
VAVAALLDDPTAIALTAVGAVVSTGAVVTYLHESALDHERIQHLQDAIPTLTSIDPRAALELAPKPSPVVTEVLKQAQPGLSVGAATPIPIQKVVKLPIDRS